jgi:hypothetical protein
MAYVPKFEFVAVVRFGLHPDRVSAELEASKRFGPNVLRVQSMADYTEAEGEASALRRQRRSHE